MKKTVCCCLLMSISYLILYSQNNSTICVTYKVNLNGNEINKMEINSAETEKFISDIGKSLNFIEYKLYCNSYSSIYFLVDKLEIKNNINDKTAIILAGKGIFYKNIKEKIKIVQKQSMGEKFNILHHFNEYKWEISTETKSINGYNCYKALGRKEEYDYARKRKNEINLVVWFTPEIPFPFGPRGIDGLPGLVLEASKNDKMYFYLTKIDFNNKETFEILKKPKGGKDILADDYLKRIAELMPLKN